jgi:hypothetical protein
MIDLWPWSHFNVKQWYFSKCNIIDEVTHKNTVFCNDTFWTCEGTLFYIISRRSSSSKFKVTKKLWNISLPGQPEVDFVNNFAVFMKQTQHPAMGCELSLLVSCMFTGHAGGRVHCSCGCWSVIHMLTIESVNTPMLERHAIRIFRQS